MFLLHSVLCDDYDGDQVEWCPTDSWPPERILSIGSGSYELAAWEYARGSKPFQMASHLGRFRHNEVERREAEDDASW